MKNCNIVANDPICRETPSMLVSLKANLALLAMPKTGTTALEIALRPYCEIVYSGHPGLKHVNLRKFDRLFRPQLARLGHGEIETFCLVREPVDWLACWYRYRGRSDMANPAKSTADISFEQFALAWLGEQPPEFAVTGRQSRFVDGGATSARVTHLFRYESFAAARRFLADRFGRAIATGIENASPQRDTFLAPATRKRLMDALAPDYALWESIGSGSA